MPSSMGGTPSASAMSRVAWRLDSVKSMSFGLIDMARQSSPPSSSIGRPAFFAPWKVDSSSDFKRAYCSDVS